MREGIDYKIIREPHYSKLIVADGVTEIDDNQFEFYLFNEIILPSTLKRIGKSAFNSNNVLKSIVIPDSVEYMGAYAFYGCIHLEFVILPKNLKFINTGTFEYTNLKTIKIPDGVKVIADNAFYILSSEKNITIDLPPSIEMLGSLAFKSTQWNVNLNDKVTYVGYKSVDDKEYEKLLGNSKQKSYSFIQPEKGIYIDLGNRKNGLVDDSLLVANKSTSKTFTLSKNGELVIKDNVVVVGDFQGLNIKSIKLPASVKYILPNAFSKNNVEQVNFPSDLIYIGANSFENASFKENKLTLGNSLMLLENDAFPSDITLNISDNCSCAHNKVEYRKTQKTSNNFSTSRTSTQSQSDQIDFITSIDNILNKDEAILRHYGYQRNMIEENKETIRKININVANEKGKKLFDLIKSNRIDDNGVEIFIDYIKDGASIYYYDNELDVSLIELLIRKSYVMLVSALFNYGYCFDENDNEFIKTFFLSATVDNTNILEFLLILGVNPNITDVNRETALNMAIKARNTKAVKLLLERGAAVGITNKDNKNAIDLARETRDMNIISLIEIVNNDLKCDEVVAEEKKQSEEDTIAEAQADLLALKKLLKGGGK